MLSDTASLGEMLRVKHAGLLCNRKDPTNRRLRLAAYLLMGILKTQMSGRIQKVHPLMRVPIKYPLVARAPNEGIYFLDPPGGLGTDCWFGRSRRTGMKQEGLRSHSLLEGAGDLVSRL